MKTPADQDQTSAGPRRRRYILRDESDIDRALHHLATRREPLSIDVRISRLARLDAQYAQDRFVRLSDGCNCLLGETLGATTFVFGSYAAWASIRGHITWWNVAIATVLVTLLGKLVERTWTRIKLAQILKDLRYRLVEAQAGRSVASMVRTPAAEPALKYEFAFNRGEDVLPEPRREPAPATVGEEIPRLALATPRDIPGVLLHLVTNLKLPLVEIRSGVLHHLVVQRAQDRLVRLAGGYTYLAAAVLAMLSFLVGMAYVVWPTTNVLLWKMEGPWLEFLLVLVAAGFAALAGCALEVLWVRLRIFWILLCLWARMLRT